MKIPAAEKGNIPVFIILSIGLLVILLIYYKISPIIYGPASNYAPSQTNTESSPSTSLKNYESKKMNLYLQYPGSFQVDDTGITLILKKGEEEIAISRNGTQFPNLKGYLKDYDSKRKLITNNVEEKTINDYQALVREVKFIPENIEQKVYYIYAQNAVYIISTSDEALYPTLDQIAQSFKYSP